MDRENRSKRYASTPAPLVVDDHGILTESRVTVTTSGKWRFSTQELSIGGFEYLRNLTLSRQLTFKVENVESAIVR